MELDAYSDEVVRSFRGRPSTRSEPWRPLIPNEAVGVGAG